MNRETLDSWLGAFPRLRIAVVGDFFLDKYLIIDPTLAERSIETGLEAHQVVAKRLSPGAAGTVISNLSALGIGTLFAVGIIGDDGEGFDLKKGLRERRVRLDHLIASPERFTPTYTKPMLLKPDGTEEEINRQDIKNRTPTPPELERAVIERLRAVVPEVDGIICMDQVGEANHGVVTDAVRDELAVLARSHPGKVFFGDSRERIGAFRNIIVKPNQFEAVRAVREGYEGEVTRSLVRECAEVIAHRNGKSVYVTLGAEGILVYDRMTWTHVRTIEAHGPIDIVGAGDSTTAAIVSALCCGASSTEAAMLGNVVASITIEQIGTTGTATPDQVRKRFDEFADAGLV